MNNFSLIQRLRNRINVKQGNTVKIGNNTRIRYCNIYVNGTGNQLIIKDGANLKGLDIELTGQDCIIEIGQNCVFGEQCYISCREANTTLVIGDNCMFSRNVKLMTSDGHDILKNGQRINPARNINIGHHVWLADNVTILKGVTVGNHSIVGINSTLAKSIDAHVVAAGNPAKTVNTDITWTDKLTY